MRARGRRRELLISYAAQREPFPHGTDLAAWKERSGPFGQRSYPTELRAQRFDPGSPGGVIEIRLGVLADNREFRNFNWLRFWGGFAAGPLIGHVAQV